MVALSLLFVRLKPSMSFDAIDKLSNWTDTSLDLQLSFSSTAESENLFEMQVCDCCLLVQVVCQYSFPLSIPELGLPSAFLASSNIKRPLGFSRKPSAAGH